MKLRIAKKIVKYATVPKDGHYLAIYNVPTCSERNYGLIRKALRKFSRNGRPFRKGNWWVINRRRRKRI